MFFEFDVLSIEERLFLVEHVFSEGDKFSENVKLKFRERVFQIQHVLIAILREI